MQSYFVCARLLSTRRLCERIAVILNHSTFGVERSMFDVHLLKFLLIKIDLLTIPYLPQLQGGH